MDFEWTHPELRRENLVKYSSMIIKTNEDKEPLKKRKFSNFAENHSRVEYASSKHKYEFFGFVLKNPMGSVFFNFSFEGEVSDEALIKNASLQDLYSRYLRIFYPNVIPSW